MVKVARLEEESPTCGATFPQANAANVSLAPHELTSELQKMADELGQKERYVE
ncbi:MAG: hypothetical protein WB681_13240 [Candidatus Cybelea sp.]